MSAENRNRLQDWTRGFWTAIPILTAQHLGIFGRLAKGPKTPVQLRRALAADERALRRLLDALLGLGLIAWEDDRLALAPKYERYLDPNSDESVTPMMDHGWHLLQSWMRLESIVLDGADAVMNFDTARVDPERERAFNHAMRSRGRDGAKDLMRAFDFREVRHVLDVGGGPGVFASEICAKFKHLRWTILDRPGALTLARRRIKDDGLDGRVKCVKGDALEDEWPTGHNAVLMSQLIHSFDEHGTRRLLSHAATSLPHGGRLLLVDFISKSDRVPGPGPGLFGINMLVNTPRGQVYSLPLLKRMLAPAFRFERFVDDASQTIIARRK